jgi:hypothetical protein
MDLFDIATLLQGPEPNLRLRKGQMVGISSDGTLVVTIGGSATQVWGVKPLGHVCYKYLAGVWLATDGMDVFALGTTAPVGPAYVGIERPSTQSVPDATDTPADFTAAPTL